MKEFKTEVIEELLEQHRHTLSPRACQQIRRLVLRGAEDLGPYALHGRCRELACLPTDILRAVYAGWA